MAWEALRVIKGIWGNPSYSYEGEYFELKMSNWAFRWCRNRILPFGCRREAANPWKRPLP